MISCALAFMIWLQKFQYANCCSKQGTYGQFTINKSEPMSGWYTFERDAATNFGDGVDYKKGYVNYFSVSTDKNYLNDKKLSDVAIVKQGECGLDGKVFFLYETVSKESTNAR